MHIAFGIIFTVIAAVAFSASAYMGTSDYNGTGVTEPGHVSAHAVIVFGIGLLSSFLAVTHFVVN